MAEENSSFEVKKLKLNCQLHGVQNNLKNGAYSLGDLGSILPAALIIHDLAERKPLGVSYMNNWGCERLGTSVNEINSIGDDYYTRYFVKEESFHIFIGISNYLENEDFSQQYNFFQRVKLHGQTNFKWFYSVCKMFTIQENQSPVEKMIVLSSPLDGVDSTITKVNQVLEENRYIKNNYRVFATLTKGEKRIIALLVIGKSSKDIAEELSISIHTVSTHRKNIIRKTECPTFAALLKFAIAFEVY